MAGLDPDIHNLILIAPKPETTDVQGRIKSGHDAE